tara:strand:+ start:360 stop:1100 length:741 start_codon:yes stop_codon:yes gene_type:complete
MKSKLVSNLSKLLATSSLLVGGGSNLEIKANQIPSSLKITVYEVGFRDSATGSLNPVFKDLTGNTLFDLIEYKGKSQNLTNGLQDASDGTFDQIYFITSNNPLVSGNNGSGCYVKKGTFSYNDGVIVGAATTNSTLAATVNNPASFTETGLSGSDDIYGPVTPVVTTSVNGSPTSSMKLVLVNDNNVSIKPYSKYFHYANLSSPVVINDKTEGTLLVTYNTDEAMSFSNDCADFSWDSLQVNLSIE